MKKMQEMNMAELEECIQRQRENNVKLYKSIPNASHEDPTNEKAEPILRKWRKGSKNLNEMLKELNRRKDALRDLSSEKSVKDREVKESREITSSTYERAEKRLRKEVETFLGDGYVV